MSALRHPRQDLDAPLGPRREAAPGGHQTVRITDACTACGACLATCPERALLRAPKRPSVVDAACTGCWACIEICPAGAIVEVGRKGLAVAPRDRPEVTA